MGSNYHNIVGKERRRLASYGNLVGTELVEVTSADGEVTGRSTVTGLRGSATGADLTKLAAITADAGEINVLDELGVTVTIALTAGAVNTLVATITVKNSAAVTVAAVHELEVWISDAASGIGLTADAFSGAVTASTGAIHTALTAKKHVLAATAATGILVIEVVDTAEPADIYVACKQPLGAGVVVSAVSGTSWG